MYSSDFVWAKVLADLEKRFGEIAFVSWLDDAKVLELTEDTLTIYTPSDLRKDIIETRVAEYIRESLAMQFDMHVTVKVLTGEQSLAPQKPAKPLFIEYNPQFTFDRFIVGPSNRFAHAAAVAVANKPAEAYNPLFIHGPSGLGKTHLLYAIAGEINRLHPDFNIVYIKGDQFTNELIASLQDGQRVEFRNKYRTADLFLVDDIQFIAGKESTQEEFFHTFNTLYENHKQIVLTSDRPPSDILRLEDRLKTRFEWGVIADINPPDYETRMAIIRNKAKNLSLPIPDEVCSYIAENITTNIRQIEGTVNKIKAYWELTGMELDVNNVSRCIKDMYKGRADTLPTPDLIIREVARFHNIEESLIRSPQKSKGTVEARQLAMYLVRKLTNLSLPDIGKEFNRDHTTVLHSINKVEKALTDSTNPIHDVIRDITANINNKV